AGSASGASAVAMSEGASGGRSHWTLTTMSACGSTISRASKMRSDPQTWSARGITVAPPALSPHAATPPESVPTPTAPRRAARARRMTCTIIGSPAMSASGLPGSLVEARRAGMTVRTIALLGLVGRRKRSRGGPVYTGCQRRGKPGICAPPRTRQPAPLPSHPLPALRRWSLEAMDSFELDKILGAILGTCLGVLAVNIAAGAIFTPVKPAKPGYEIAVPEQKPGGEAKPQEQEQQQPIEQLLAKADVGRG